MSSAPRDDNRVPSLTAKSDADNSPVILEADPVTKRLKTTTTVSGTVVVDPSSQTSIYDSTTNINARVDTFGNVRVAQQKRILGGNFGGSIDTTYTYTIVNNTTGTTTAAIGQGTLATGTTALGSTKLTTINKARYLSGRNNLFRAVIRMDAGVTNNVREFGIYADVSNQFVFRLSDSTFQIVTKRNGTETVVSSGSFNGNGSGSTGVFAPGTTFHSYEILYSTSSIRFMIDNLAVHRVTPTSTSITGSLVGQLYISNVNSGALTTNVTMDILTWSVSHLGDAVNNPNMYNLTAVTTGLLLKGGGGTLQSVMLTRAGGLSAQLTLYDGLDATGKQIGQWDMATGTSVGQYQFGPDGANFYTGLFAVASGTVAPGSAIILWD